MEKVKFSIVIPAYKASYLKECVDSVLEQSYGNWELIVVDDDSPNNLKPIIDLYDDSRIFYHRNKKNCGALNVVDNWNICLSYCTGDYVICMGDDDKLFPDCLTEYARLIRKYPGNGWTEIIDEKSNFFDITAPRAEFESCYSLVWNRWNGRTQQFIGDWCFEIEWLRSQGGFFKIPLAWSSDDITAAIAAMKNGVANSQELCFQYRVNSQTISKTGNVYEKMNAKLAEKKWYENFLERKPENELDLKYWLSLKKQFVQRTEKAFAMTISMDLKKHPLHLFSWFRRKKIYGYSNKIRI